MLVDLTGCQVGRCRSCVAERGDGEGDCHASTQAFISNLLAFQLAMSSLYTILFQDVDETVGSPYKVMLLPSPPKASSLVISWVSFRICQYLAVQLGDGSLASPR